MKFTRNLILGTVTTALVAGTVLAQGSPNPAVTARHGLMDLMAFNVGILFGMAKGGIPYDATAAQAAAANLASLADSDWTAYFAEGTEAGKVDGSRALPEIWADMDGLKAKKQGLMDAVADAVSAAGNGADMLGGPMGAVGAACTACHKAYRQPS